MNLQRVEQIEKDPILNVLQYAVGPSEISLKKAVLFYERNKATLHRYEEKACIGIENWSKESENLSYSSRSTISS